MTNPDYTHLALIVDRSGSMGHIAKDMNGGIKKLLQDQINLPGKLLVDVATFDERIERPYSNAPAETVFGDFVQPRGSTALHDAVGSTIAQLGGYLSTLDEDERPGKVIVVIVTDGMENSSREYTAEVVKQMVEEQRDTYGWEFLFLGAPEADAFNQAQGMGIGRGQTISFAATSAGVSGTYDSTSAYLTRSRAGDASEFTEAERLAAETA